MGGDDYVLFCSSAQERIPISPIENAIAPYDRILLDGILLDYLVAEAIFIEARIFASA